MVFDFGADLQLKGLPRAVCLRRAHTDVGHVTTPWKSARV
jgi:hypothetical protein